ncbi:MAG TPA: dTMP kinase [Thermoanaerobaculia bacterium]|nr:dTMP kinase [Thermoanaerobaculia bacterium]
MQPGRIISFEGISNAGKTSAIRRLRRFLEDEDYPVIVKDDLLHYKGRSIGGEIKRILDRGKPSYRLGVPVAETLLICAKRAYESQTRLEPAVVQGKIVLCDRDIDTVCAYQLDVLSEYRSFVPRAELIQWIRCINQLGVVEPTLTFYLSVTPDGALEREQTARKSILPDVERAALRSQAEEHLQLFEAVLSIPMSQRKLVKIDTTDLSEEDVFQNIRTASLTYL